VWNKTKVNTLKQTYKPNLKKYFANEEKLFIFANRNGTIFLGDIK